VSESEAPDKTSYLLLKYIKGNIGTAIELFESLTSSIEDAIAAADVDAASKVVIAVRLGRVIEKVEILKVAVANLKDLSDAMLEVISVLLRTLEDINTGRLDDAEKELRELLFDLDKIFERVFDGCTKAQLGEVGGSGQA